MKTSLLPWRKRPLQGEEAHEAERLRAGNELIFYPILCHDYRKPFNLRKGGKKRRDNMICRILADSVVLIHFFWILFLFAGGIWGVRHKVIKILHLLGLAFALLIQLFGWYCPLTHLEIWLRSKHDPSLTYADSFIIHYVEKVVYLELSRYWILFFTLLLCGVNAWAYLRKKNPSSPSKK